MIFAVTNVAMPPTPVLASNAEPPMAADGTAVAAGAEPDVSAAGTPGMRDPRQSEDTNSAQIGVQVPNAFLGIFIASSSNPATAPQIATAAASADYAVNAAASTQSANSESAGISSSIRRFERLEFRLHRERSRHRPPREQAAAKTQLDRHPRRFVSFRPGTSYPG